MSTGGKRIPGRYRTKIGTIQGTGGTVWCVRRNPDLHGVLCSAVDPINVRTDIGLVSEMVGVVEGID